MMHSGDTSPTSVLLLELAGRARRGPVYISDIIEIAGRRAHAAILAIVALPEALPLPVAGMSTILAIPLILVSVHMAVFGAAKGIPQGVAKRPMPRKLVAGIGSRGARILKRVERISRPRLQPLADRDRLVALICLLLALVIAMPIPFGNLPPAACVLLMALGMIQRDGVFVVAGFAGGLIILSFVSFVGHTVLTNAL